MILDVVVAVIRDVVQQADVPQSAIATFSFSGELLACVDALVHIQDRYQPSHVVHAIYGVGVSRLSR